MRAAGLRELNECSDAFKLDQGGMVELVYEAMVKAGRREGILSQCPYPSDEPAEDEYSILSDEQWLAVLELLHRDLRLNRHGTVFVAPQYPEAGQEMYVGVELECDGMVWIPPGMFERSLSDAILADNRDHPDELERATASLENTVAVLKAAAKRMQE
jgi:hypothetical protein